MSFILEPGACVYGSINKVLFSSPMRQILYPIPFISITILKIISAKPMFEIVLVFSNILLRIRKILLTFSIFQVIFPFSFIYVKVSIYVFAIPMPFTSSPLAIIHTKRFRRAVTFSMILIIFCFTKIMASISKIDSNFVSYNNLSKSRPFNPAR